MVKRIANATIGADNICASIKTPIHAILLIDQRFPSDSFYQTSLQEELKARRIDTLIICGFQSEFCVDTTTRRALALGYPVILVADGHATLNNSILSAAQISAHHNETLANITSFGVRARAIPASEVSVEA